MLQLIALPAFTDNYVWLIHDSRHAVVVDPGESTVVVSALQRLSLTLAGILVTHHHPDHVGGIDALRSVLDGPVWAPGREAVPKPHVGVQEGDRISVLGQTVEVIDVPGHTAGHVAYRLHRGAEPDWLFCGDTLFSAGCGRLFEGTPAQMVHSLDKLRSLPGETLVCCAHEYTLSNLRFAALAEPGNADIVRHQHTCEALRQQQRPTLPSTIDLERRINPFLRWDAPAVIAAAHARGCEGSTPAAVLGALREWKNQC